MERLQEVLVVSDWDRSAPKAGGLQGKGLRSSGVEEFSNFGLFGFRGLGGFEGLGFPGLGFRAYCRRYDMGYYWGYKKDFYKGYYNG